MEKKNIDAIAAEEATKTFLDSPGNEKCKEIMDKYVKEPSSRANQGRFIPIFSIGSSG